MKQIVWKKLIIHKLNLKFYYANIINIFVELDYGLYMRSINLNNHKNYEIDTDGVNSWAIY